MNRKRTNRGCLTALLAVLATGALVAASAMPAAAQAETATQRTITVGGEGEASAPPDVAYVTVGVQTQNDSAAAAVADNSRRLAAVLDAMRARGVASRDLQTSGLNVSPQFDRNQQITGYQATNNVTITVNEVDRAGDLLDAALAAGANRIGGLRFGIRDTSALHDQALGDAARVARVRAEAALAAALGLRVLGVSSVSETTTSSPQPFVARAAAASVPGPGAPPPPVESGELRVTVQVRVSFLFEP